MSTGINVTKPIKILDEGVLLTPDVSQIDFTGGVTATTVGNNVTVNVPAAGITVGTTPVTSGTDGRVFFQAGGVVQQSDRFTFDNTTATNILQLGAGANLGVSLRTIAPGATSGDIAFRVRNSADTKNIIEVRGDSETRWNGAPAVGNYVGIKNYTSYDANIDLVSGDGVKARIWNDVSSNSNINRGVNIFTPGIVGASTAKINNIIKSGLSAYGAGYGFNWAVTSNASGVFTQAERALWLTSTKSMVLFNGSSIPDTHTEKTDSFELYSADITAGNAAPHFRTEVGDIVKLYKQSSAGITTVADLVTVLTNLGLLG